jgi:hypothetical protein
MSHICLNLDVTLDTYKFRQISDILLGPEGILLFDWGVTMCNSHGNSKESKHVRMKLDGRKMGRDTSYFRPLQFTMLRQTTGVFN